MSFYAHTYFLGIAQYKNKTQVNTECSFKFLLKLGIEDSIVNAPLIRLQSKNTNNPKSEVRFKQLIGGI
jgi:hypothetical protein